MQSAYANAVENLDVVIAQISGLISSSQQWYMDSGTIAYVIDTKDIISQITRANTRKNIKIIRKKFITLKVLKILLYKLVLVK